MCFTLKPNYSASITGPEWFRHKNFTIFFKKLTILKFCNTKFDFVSPRINKLFFGYFSRPIIDGVNVKQRLANTGVGAASVLGIHDPKMANGQSGQPVEHPKIYFLKN
ncbi:hypothetical protein BpHYR1_052752 [Brachionus plicatilis]|uniref:Uncharacterized protein n=1 Tax=Brachionus plicatilis TaxID=10195 RepID=A0A3M7QK90_BRAPC|nr:hypothetical protein BpHYR1_052752 [Brachionus plicatilis]